MNRVLHADLDAFYASVEQRDQPRLRGKAMAVGGGVILAASYEARSFGVRTAMNVRQARQRCPQLIVVEPRMQAYSEASKAVFEIFRDTSPFVEALSIDEAFLDITGLLKLMGPDVELAKRLQARVGVEVGLAISVGGGSTKFLAKVASALGKPNGLLIVPPGGELDFLHPLPVDRLWGVGPVARTKLAAVGIKTVGQVAALEERFLITALGESWGRHLYALAHNRDPRHVDTERRRRSVGSQRSFRAGTVNRRGAEEILLEVVDRVASRLRSGRRVARTVVLRLRFGDFQGATRSQTMVEPSNATGPILRTGRALLAEAWPIIESRGVTKVGIAVTGLQADAAVQLCLPFGKGNEMALDSAIDEIRDRFGSTSLVRSSLIGKPRIEMPLLPD